MAFKMKFSREQRQQLLNGNSSSDADGPDIESGKESTISTTKHQRSLTRTSPWLLACLIVSVVINGLVTFEYLTRGSTDAGLQEEQLAPLDYLSTRKSPYSGLSHDTQVVYTHSNEYTSSNKTLADEMWEKLDNVLAIAVTEDWAKEKGLPHSWTFPWDLDRKVYFPKVGHQLHCLKSIRKAFHQLWETGETQLAHSHLEHCLDSMRQDFQCQLDDTPMPAMKPVACVGDNQVMQCKSWQKFHAWIEAPERHSCYKHMNAYKGVKHPIERYAFCPEGSDTYAVMKEYFDIHGHVETVVDLG